MKINYQFVSRALIALLFVVAGYGKLMNFSGSAKATVETMTNLGLPLPMLIAILVIIIEIPVALAFAWGYRICTTGGILAVFTLLTILLVHNHWPGDKVMILKNVAVIGGIMSAMTMCCCGKCPMGKCCKECKGDKKCEKCSA